MAEPNIGGKLRAGHPTLPLLVGGLSLSVRALEARPDASQLQELIGLLRNAEYWIGFDLSPFEPLLTRTPSPLRELAVGLVLRYGECLDGRILAQDVARAKEHLIPELPTDLKPIQGAIDTLERAISARDAQEAKRREGFQWLKPKATLSVHGLMSGVGRAKLTLDNQPLTTPEVSIPLGTTFLLSATDEKGRPTERPELENDLQAPILARDEPDPGARSFFLSIPGVYRARVPGRVEGDRRIISA